MPKPPDHKLMHVHAQGHQHDEAYIVANRAALAALRDALNVILNAPAEGIEAWSVASMASDGEGYDLVIVMDNSTWSSPTWRKAAMPYQAADAAEARADALWPWEIARTAIRIGEPEPRAQGATNAAR